MVLRPYQENLVNEIRDAMRQHRSNLLRLPTGGGKTAIATDLCSKAVFKGNSTYFICHRQELLDQTAKTFRKAGLDYLSFIASGWPHDPRCPIQICSIGSLSSRLSKVKIPKLALWDEAHHLGAGGWQKVKSAFCSSYHIGLSATPERLDGKGLGKHFDNMIMGPSESWLIENGYLSDYVIYGPPPPDLGGVHKRMGDYAKNELAAAMDKSKITGDIISHWKKHGAGKRTILFAVNVEHSKHMVQQFLASGIVAVHLDGECTHQERRIAARDFADGKIDILSNVELFGEGYDLSAQADRDVTVDCVIQARPTQSLALHRQQVGRCLRPKADGSKAVILDHAGNAWRLGFPDDDHPWSLDGVERDRSSKAEKDIAVRVCPKCKGMHKVAPVCKYCGFVYPVVARVVEQVEGSLEQLDRSSVKAHRMREQARLKTIDDLVEYGRKRGMKNPEGWAGHVWTARQAKRAQR